MCLLCWPLFHLYIAVYKLSSNLETQIDILCICSWFCNLDRAQKGQLTSAPCSACWCWNIHDSISAHISDSSAEMAQMIGGGRKSLPGIIYQGPWFLLWAGFSVLFHVAIGQLLLTWSLHGSLSCLCKKFGWPTSKGPKVEVSRFLRHNVSRLGLHSIGFSTLALLTFGAG